MPQSLITIDYNQSLLEMTLRAGIPAYMRKDLEKILGPLESFQFDQKGIQTFEVEELCFEKPTTGKAIAKLVKEDRQDWQPFGIEHLLEYGISHKKKFASGSLFFAVYKFYKGRIFMMHSTRQSFELELIEDHPWSNISKFPKCRLVGK